MKSPIYNPKMKVMLCVQALLVVVGLAVSVMRLILIIRTTGNIGGIAGNGLIIADFLMIIAYALFHWDKDDGFFRGIIYGYTGMLVLTNFIYYGASMIGDLNALGYPNGVGAVSMLNTICYGILLVFADNLQNEKKATYLLIFAVVLSIITLILRTLFMANLVDVKALVLVIMNGLAPPVLLGSIGLAYHNRCYRKNNGLS